MAKEGRGVGGGRRFFYTPGGEEREEGRVSA